MARTQTERPFRLKSSLGDDALLLESFEGYERISTPFRFVLRAVSENPDLNLEALLRTPLVLSISGSGGRQRHIHGNVSRAKLVDAGEDFLANYEIEMVAWPWFLNLFSDCRIFQNMTVPNIIEQVFRDRGFSDFRPLLQGSYEPREYCVQYRETDFNFVSRLMEEEGIYYFFEQTRDRHIMILADSKAVLAVSPRQPRAVRYVPVSGGVFEHDTLHTLQHELQVHTGKSSLNDYDFTSPTRQLLSEVEGQRQPAEIYDYPGRYFVKSEGDRYVRIRQEEQEVQLSTVRAQTNCQGIECGYKFTLADHFRSNLNQEYLITALWQRGVNTSYSARENTAAYEYGNHIEAIPAAVPFRPPRLAQKPFVRGSQTAVVTGPAGEEIWTDQYGRVKVHFFWAREGPVNENSSCFVRVAHASAGANWGFFALPRIGHEVVVTFLEGDPDRPLITGSVHNGDQMPPYALPGEQTKSTWKTLSSKGGGGFNEIRMEDSKGAEEIFIHAEKDLHLRVKNDRLEWIGHDRDLMVINDRREKIGQDEHNLVTRDRVEKIGRDHYLNIIGKEGVEVIGDHSLTVKGNVVEVFGSNHSTEVKDNVLVKAKQVVLEASTGITLKVGGNFITIDSSGVAVKGTMIQLNSGGAALSDDPGDAVSLMAPAEAHEAVNEEPGAVGSPRPANPTTPLSMSLETVSPAGPEPEPGDVPDRAAPQRVSSGSSYSQPEYATFPRDVDPVAVAEVHREAAKSGAPFCEECQRNRNN